MPAQKPQPQPAKKPKRDVVVTPAPVTGSSILSDDSVAPVQPTVKAQEYNGQGNPYGQPGTGFSASHIMWIIQALLDKYDIDRSDFVYNARSNKKAVE